MSTELQEIITNSSIRSFNQGYNMGRDEERVRIVELLRLHAEYDNNPVHIELIKIIENKPLPKNEKENN